MPTLTHHDKRLFMVFYLRKGGGEDSGSPSTGGRGEVSKRDHLDDTRQQRSTDSTRLHAITRPSRNVSGGMVASIPLPSICMHGLVTHSCAIDQSDASETSACTAGSKGKLLYCGHVTPPTNVEFHICSHQWTTRAASANNVTRCAAPPYHQQRTLTHGPA